MEAPEEFQLLFTMEYRAVAWSVHLVLHDYGHAEEITQDAFVRLLENWEKVSRYDRPGAWVRRVAIRLATRAATRERARAAVESALPQQSAPTAPDVDLIAAIRELSPQQRAAVALHYLEDRPVMEVADLLGCSVATAKVHLHRARTRLAKLLGEEVESDVR